MRAVPTKSCTARPVDRETHAGTPTESVTGQRFDDDVAIDAGQPLQLLHDHAALISR